MAITAQQVLAILSGKLNNISSAYDVAVQEGYTGTKAQWLASLNGTSATWHTGTAITGTTTGISATVTGANVGDMYLNDTTMNVYKCTAANTWNYVCNIKGAQFTSTDIATIVQAVLQAIPSGNEVAF